MRLATLLVKRKLKPADLLFKLDEDHNGMVDEEEFAQWRSRRRRRSSARSSGS